MTTEKNGMIIVNKSGYMGSKKPCNGCGKCGKDDAQNNNQNQGDLEPLYPFPLGVRKIEGEREEGEESDLEKLLPVGVGVEEEN